MSDEPDRVPCRHTVIEYDERGWGTCRLCWQPVDGVVAKAKAEGL